MDTKNRNIREKFVLLRNKLIKKDFDFAERWINKKLSRFDGEVDPVPHPTVSLECKGEMIDIDVEIAPLMKEIWKAGIETNMSCQDNTPKGYILLGFHGSMAADSFLLVVFGGQDIKNSDVYRRAQCRAENNWILSSQVLSAS